MTKKLTLWIGAVLLLGTFVVAACAGPGLKPGTKLFCPKCGSEIIVPGGGAP